MFRLIFSNVIKKIQHFAFKHGKKMSVDERRNREEFFAKLYAFITISGFCILVRNYYMSGNNSGRIPHIEGENFRHISFQGFKKVRDCDVVLGPDNTMIVKKNNLEGTSVPESYKYPRIS